MSAFRLYEVSDSVLKQARELGMFGNVKARLSNMAKSSAPFKHEEANRRYEGYLFMIKGDTITSVFKHRQPGPAPYTPHRFRAVVREDVPEGKTVCPDCENDGGPCATCNDTGYVTHKEAAELNAMNDAAGLD